MDEAGSQTDLGEVLIPHLPEFRRGKQGEVEGRERREEGGEAGHGLCGAVGHSSNGSPPFLPNLEQQFPDPAVSAL